MPLAPACMVVWIAFLIARRKAMRFSRASATTSATSVDSSSGRLISRTVRWQVMPVISWRFFFSWSTRTPLRPTRTPGRAVCTMMLTASPVRSISMRGTPAERYSL